MTIVVDWDVKHHLYHCKCKDLSILLQLLNVLRTENGVDHDDTAVVECLTRDRRVAGSSLTGVTALWSLSKTHLS